MIMALNATALTVLSTLAFARPDPPEPVERPARPQLYITSYSWELGGANCDNDCGHTALTHTGPELFGHTAGCPVRWLGHRTTTVVHVLGYEFWCVDTFGREIDRGLLEIDGIRVFRLDVAWKVPREWPYNNMMVAEYGREWRPMSEFYALRERWLSELQAGGGGHDD
jgi:hypothetical protein